MKFPPPPIPLDLMPRYTDEPEHCRHVGPHAGTPFACQGCGDRLICGYCTYHSHHRYVCIVCYYRVDAWRVIEERATRKAATP